MERLHSPSPAPTPDVAAPSDERAASVQPVVSVDDAVARMQHAGSHGAQRDLMAWIATHRGNAFALEVAARYADTGSAHTTSTSTRDHVEAAGGRAMIKGYDALRAAESFVRSDLPPRAQPPEWLTAAWATDQAVFKLPKIKHDHNAALGADRALAESRALMMWDRERGHVETAATDQFFAAHPSGAAATVPWFQSIWNESETFADYPLQAFMYASASPVTSPEESGQGQPAPEGERAPKSALWAAYARAVAEHLPNELVEEAYFRAHIADMKTAFASPRFQKLYERAPANYRAVVEAYAETIARDEAELDGGRPIGEISRGLFIDGLRDLVDRGTVGMLWTKAGAANAVTADDRAKLLAKKSAAFFRMQVTPDRPARTDANTGVFEDVGADGRVEIHEVWEITQRLRDGAGVLDAAALDNIRTFAEQQRAAFTPEAYRLVEKLLAKGPHGPVTDAEVAAAPDLSHAKAIKVELTPAQYATLRREYHIEIPDGATEITEAMMADASFAEVDRREDRSTPPKRWPLTFRDLKARQLRAGLTMAGTDGVLQFDEITGAIHNVEGRVRSELINTFHQQYPVAPGNILQYSANVLALHQTYGEIDFYNMVPQAIIPIDNDGKPKNQLWRDFTEAYDRHKTTGAPSMEVLEKLWIRAHMEDFKAVDGPAFTDKMNDFWERAAMDPALESMAVYAKAMVLGRKVFDRAREHNLTEEAAMAESAKHFTKTLALSGNLPFAKEDLRALREYYTDESRASGAYDARGLPTDRTLAERAAEGFAGLPSVAPLAGRGMMQELEGSDARVPATEMVDMHAALPDDQEALVDPMVYDFYQHPLDYDMTGAAQLGDLQNVALKLVGMLTGQGHMPAATGTEPMVHRPIEQSLWKDRDGGVHWDRDVVLDGHQQTLFHAKFENVGAQIRETFDVRGVEVALTFNVTAHDGGVKIQLDPSSVGAAMGVMISSITFTAVPVGGALHVTGTYEGLGSSGGGHAEFVVTPKRR